MNIGGYEVSMAEAALGAVVAIWLATLIAGAVSWEKHRKGTLRRTDIFVLVVSLISGSIWVLALMPRSVTASVPSVSARVSRATCAVIAPGDTEAKVKERLGDPDEIRGEEETRGPASNVWIYRDSRCAIHFFGDRVESIE